jgi:hypothetical protein
MPAHLKYLISVIPVAFALGDPRLARLQGDRSDCRRFVCNAGRMLDRLQSESGIGATEWRNWGPADAIYPFR